MTLEEEQSKENYPTSSMEIKAHLKGNIVIPEPWYDEKSGMWLEWIPWDEI